MPYEPSSLWKAEVVSVSDGDTFRVKNPEGGKNVAIRLYGIDTPEKSGRMWNDQPFSRQSSEFVRSVLPKGSRPGLITKDTDRYKRIVALVVLPDGRILQEALLEAGLAWVYPQYCKGCDAWKRLEQAAKDKGKGLWGGTTPVPPWEWRKAGRAENAAAKTAARNKTQ